MAKKLFLGLKSDVDKEALIIEMANVLIYMRKTKKIWEVEYGAGAKAQMKRWEERADKIISSFTIIEEDDGEAN